MRQLLFGIFLFGCFLSTSAQEEEIDLSSGRSMYNAWCAKCHGEDGRGIVEGLELEASAPDFTDCSFNSREPRKDWIAVVTHGGPVRGLSWSMPAWGEAISKEQIDFIIDYMKTFCSDSRWPQGELNFRRSQVTAKAYPENEALVIPTYSHSQERSSSTKLVYEERIGARGQWEISVPVMTNLETSQTGLGDIELSVKHALFDDLQSLSIVSVGLEIGVPTGSREKGFSVGSLGFSPFLAAGKGFDNLILQSSIKYVLPFPLTLSQLQYNLAFTYHLTDEKHGVIPMIELNGVAYLHTGENTLSLTPQLYVGLVRRGHLAFSLGTQFPVAGVKPYDYRIVAFLLWEYMDGGLWW